MPNPRVPTVVPFDQFADRLYPRTHRRRRISEAISSPEPAQRARAGTRRADSDGESEPGSAARSLMEALEGLQPLIQEDVTRLGNRSYSYLPDNGRQGSIDGSDDEYGEMFAAADPSETPEDGYEADEEHGDPSSQERDLRAAAFNAMASFDDLPTIRPTESYEDLADLYEADTERETLQRARRRSARRTRSTPARSHAAGSPTSFTDFINNHLRVLFPLHPVYPSPKEVCSMCHEGFNENHAPVLIHGLKTCHAHVFGYSCLRKWFTSGMANSNKCPLCRTVWFKLRRFEMRQVMRVGLEITQAEEAAGRAEDEAIRRQEEEMREQRRRQRLSLAGSQRSRQSVGWMEWTGNGLKGAGRWGPGRRVITHGRFPRHASHPQRNTQASSL
ncbi:hypothetical protein BDV96DRAFT_599011 [Lophiotrema nucula]|uniref:RING-type domain-containing protein n=1 Tax=Lophiotrema nucula TaxID=690887 RepID=A0A6A5ZAN1_9PLEO|nr:hypothetical protein BDV96DRAFT_599011 [Lophiotrema nucula]